MAPLWRVAVRVAAPPGGAPGEVTALLFADERPWTDAGGRARVILNARLPSVGGVLACPY